MLAGRIWRSVHSPRSLHLLPAGVARHWLTSKTELPSARPWLELRRTRASAAGPEQTPLAVRADSDRPVPPQHQPALPLATVVAEGDNGDGLTTWDDAADDNAAPPRAPIATNGNDSKTTASKSVSLTPDEEVQWKTLMRKFRESEGTKDYAESVDVMKAIYERTMAAFRKWMRATDPASIKSLIVNPELHGEDGSFTHLRKCYTDFVNTNFGDAVGDYRTLKRQSDMRLPHEWYPNARETRRRIVYHMGPTNSGKTYNAMQSLLTSYNGVYCAPLRLLALEVYDKLNQQGKPCTLLTGQEFRETPDAFHLSCTVEMIANAISSATRFDVAVIDEIQMIADENRGWAWTYAFLGLCAKEIHLCGDPSVKDLITRLCAFTGDDLEFCSYERRTTLNVSESLNNNLAKIEPGDCIIAFSRSKLIEMKALIETSTKFRSAMVYGKLPPEVRAQQANVFNMPGSGVDVLVASDAVGMGLNLNIRRIVFSTLTKFDGTDKRSLNPSEIKQIAGRAGRYGSIYPEGYVTCLNPSDMGLLRRSLAQPLEPREKAGLLPFLEQVDAFARVIPKMKLSNLMDYISTMAQLDGNYFMCNLEDFQRVADRLNGIKNLELSERFLFCSAPVPNLPVPMTYLIHFGRQYADSREVKFEAKELPRIRNDMDMVQYESHIAAAEAYIWLSFRLPGFNDRDSVVDYRGKLINELSRALNAMWNLRTNRSSSPQHQQHFHRQHSGRSAPPPLRLSIGR